MKRWPLLTILFISLSTAACAPKKGDAPETDTPSDVAELPQSANAPLANDDNDAANENSNDPCGRPYGKFAKDNGIPIPQIDDKAIEYTDAECNGHYNVFTMKNFDFRSAYEKDLLAAGFKKSDNAFVKGEETDQAAVVAFRENKNGETPFALVMANSRDPENYYAKLPDKRIPYPLDNSGMAAKIDEINEPDEASNETVFIYKAKSKEFVQAYQKRLEDVGFANVRIPEAPLYVKSVEGNVELSVAVNFDDEDGMLSVNMMVIQLK